MKIRHNVISDNTIRLNSFQFLKWSLLPSADQATMTMDQNNVNMLSNTAIEV